ncbi:hypothetical protein ASG49_13895 [Marmoricola sp. Leaf446]|uniref:HAD-IA family hydrolase n=1 Tax=Marmoricola sp. Leaf446 TaxID=1736379 RepID=UPI0006FC451A|nr:HAD-IA family hydrolase [Marmoricola sp. Leaf446]KQT90824.1 hypothetical protein ASG49_13895 [Marmoricola sp. Leaf446]
MTHLDVAGLLFDNDGVLVDSVASGNEAWTQWAGEHDLDAAHVLELIHGRRAADTVATLLPADQVVRATERIDELELSTSGATVALPGALALLTSLTEAGLPWAVATSATRRLALARLGAAGLPVPDVLVTADDVAHGKPAPDPYVEAATRLGLDPADCVVLEDSPAGVEAGVAAGARVVGVSLPEGAPGTDLVVADLSELTAVAQGAGVRLRRGRS